MRFLKEYLYSEHYTGYDYAVGLEYYKKYQAPTSMCTSVRKGNFIGRNLDWYYDNHAEVLVSTRRGQGRFATIGVAHTSGPITNEALKDGTLPEYLYSVIPFMLADGLNEKGVYCSMNVVPVGDKPNTSPIGNAGLEICQLMLPRYICDFAESADAAIDILQKNTIYAPFNIVNQECHLMICDENASYVVEFVDGQIKVHEANYVTNFYLDGWNGTIASKVLGSTDPEIEASGLTDHSMGLERYKLISERYSDLETEEDLTELMFVLRYSNAYDKSVDPFWYSEFYGETKTFGDLTIYSTAEEMEGIVDYAIEHSGKRDGQSWITTHTSIYDIEGRKLHIYAEEDFDQMFGIDMDESDPYGIVGIEELYGRHKLV